MAEKEQGLYMEIVQDKVLFDLSYKITDEWRNVARNLSISEAEIYRILRDNSHCTQEQIYQVLLLWKKKEGNDATSMVLSRALKEASRKDLADDLSWNQASQRRSSQEYIGNINPMTPINESYHSSDVHETDPNITGTMVQEYAYPGEPTTEGDSNPTDNVEDHGTDVNEDIGSCSKHRSLQLDKYCETCDMQVCAECVFDFHKIPECCVIALIDTPKKTDEKRREISRLLRSIESQCLAVEDESRITQNLKTYQNGILRNEVLHHAEEVYNLLDKNKNSLLNGLTSKHLQVRRKYDKDIDDLKNFQARLRCLKDELHSITSKTDKSLGDIRKIKLSLENMVTDLAKR